MMKKAFLILLLLFIPFLCAFGEQVDLLDNDKLIDLHKAINVTPGGSSLTETEGETGGEDTSAAPSGENSHTAQNAEIEIRVQGREIYYNGRKYSDNFKGKLEKDINARFILVDDYAEAHTYRNVLRIMRTMHEEDGLEFTEKTAEE